MKNNWKFKLGVISILGLLAAFLIYSLYYGQQFTRTEVGIRLGDKELRIVTNKLKTSREQAPAADSKDFREYYVDTMRGFYFKLPNSKSWSKPELVKGLEVLLEKSGIPLTPEMRKQIKAFESSPMFGPLVREAETLILTSGEPIELEITNETSNQALNVMIELARLNSESKGVKLGEKELATLRHQLIGFERMKFANSFSITIFRKGILKELPIKISLPNFFVTYSLYLRPNLVRLEANEQSILMAKSYSLEHIKLNGRKSDIRIDSWFLFAESPGAFYVVNIDFSHQAGSSLQAWEELRALMDSFRIIEE